MSFKLIKKSKKSAARLGEIKTRHGAVMTPFFMPVATQGVVKLITTDEIKRLGAEVLLANTYHLLLKPGEQLIKAAGGLHKFMNWSGPIITDSGGFQVFSLSGAKTKSGKSLIKIDRNGVKFKSYIDGRSYYLTPERSLAIQRDLGVDIAVCLDECVALPADKKYLEQSVELTTAWAAKTKKYFDKLKGEKPLLFCVIQGGINKELRQKSLRDLTAVGFSVQACLPDRQGGPVSGWDGYNIGGLSVGESTREMLGVLEYLAPAMPVDKPRYLMGVGYPENILEAVKRGIDMFDCVIPTREGRHGRLFFKVRSKKLEVRSKKFYHAININGSKFAKDFSPIKKDSKLPELRNLSKAYLHYLFKIKEPLGQRLASLNNVEFYLDLMAEIRQAIKEGDL